jgi:diguanylate cyclase (GGDEF)-like protein
MNITNWLPVPGGQLLSAAAAIVILILMLLMSLRLHTSYRNKLLYRVLIAAIGLMLGAHSLAAIAAVAGSGPGGELKLAYSTLHILSFIIISFVFMKLHTGRLIQVKVAPFIVLGALTLISAFTQLALSKQLAGAIGESGRYSAPLLDLCELIVILVLLLGIRSVDIGALFTASLVVLFVSSLTGLADTYVFDGSAVWLTALRLLLPVVYCGLLFAILFEWVIGRLLSTYQSAITDGLTGLYNRRHFAAKAGQLLKESKSAAVIFCDIDNFKRLNDTHGHHQADIVLRQTADIIKEESGGIGYAGRYGGEELLACIRTGRIKAADIAEAIRKRVEQETPVTISIGYSTTKESRDIAVLVKQADEAMYRSKTTGKNKVTAFKKPKAQANQA